MWIFNRHHSSGIDSVNCYNRTCADTKNKQPAYFETEPGASQILASFGQLFARRAVRAGLRRTRSSALRGKPAANLETGAPVGRSRFFGWRFFSDPTTFCIAADCGLFQLLDSGSASV
jgi:hypothetical protein